RGPESITTGSGYGFRARGLRPRPGMTSQNLRGLGIAAEYPRRRAACAPQPNVNADRISRPLTAGRGQVPYRAMSGVMRLLTAPEARLALRAEPGTQQLAAH